MMDIEKIAAIVFIIGIAMLFGDCMGTDGPKDLTIKLDIPVTTTFEIPITTIGLSASNSFTNTTAVTAVCNNANGFSLYATMDNGGYLKSIQDGHSMVNPLLINLPEMIGSSPLTSMVVQNYGAGSHSGNLAFIQQIAIGELAGSYQGKITIGLTPSP